MIDDKRIGRIFFADKGIRGEIEFTYQQADEFINLIVDSGVFDSKEIKKLFSVSPEAQIHVVGWDFSRRYNVKR